ncbi:MAG: HlyD family secretion protein [Methylobacteriaceae bacterium]|jgi:HlyD family secretion protein|nr:HlyD family secretion protein [Methylobacteriaceae bacterium]
MKKIFIAALLLTASLAWWFADAPLVRDQLAWGGAQLGIHPGKAAPAPSQYITAAVEQGELRRVTSATGTLNAIINVEVGSQLSGQVAELLVDFNDDVKKHQPLARLDQRSFKAHVAEAQAAMELAQVSVEAARARLERAEIDARDSEAQRAVLKARTDNARVKFESARTELHRKETLRERQVGTAVDTEDAQTKVASAAASLREAEAIAAAQENLVAGTKADLRRVKSELESALASIPQKQALLDVAQIDLDRTTIRSPIDGVIVGRNVNEGQTLATTLEAKTLFIVAGDLHQMQIEAKVDEADIGKIRVGQEATFTVDSHPGRQFSGLVRQVRKAPQVVQNVVTYIVVLSAANPENLLLPGMTALVRITVNRTGPVLKVPLAALRYAPKPKEGAAAAEQSSPGNGIQPAWAGDLQFSRGRAASVWTLGPDGQPRSVLVGLGEDDSSHAAVLGGPLSAGDRVIIGEAATAAPRRLFGIRIGL